MSSERVPVESDGGQQGGLLPASVRERLRALYSRVPRVSCTCDRLGQCCELTEAERADDYATMYPLYTVEYLNIVDYVQRRFDPKRQQDLLEMTEERPMRCPFLTEAQACEIHPVRPLMCRTYGVLQREEVEAAGSAARGDVPASWIWRFLSTERYTVCPMTRVLDPGKVAAYTKDMVSHAYERTLILMGGEVDPLDAARREALQQASGKARLMRWTWGGFNVLMRSPLPWLRKHFGDYWEASFLAD